MYTTRVRERGAGAEFVHKTICILLISSKDILNEIIVDMGLFNNILFHYVCLKTNFNIVEIYLINNKINEGVQSGKSTYIYTISSICGHFVRVVPEGTEQLCLYS